MEGADRVLLGVPGAARRRRGRSSCEKLGVTVQLDRLVTGVDAEGVTLAVPGGGTERLESRTIVWAAGVAASPLGAVLARATGADLDRAGRVTVLPDLTLPGHPEILVLGDMTRVSDGQGGLIPLPGVAPAAMQMGRYAAKVVEGAAGGAGAARPVPVPRQGQPGDDRPDEGRRRHQGHAAHRPVRVAGLAVIHLFYLTGLQNRVLVFIRWTVSFLTHGRGARLITGEAPGEAGC